MTDSINPDFHSLNIIVEQLIKTISRDLLLPSFQKGIDASQLHRKPDNSVVTHVDLEAQEMCEKTLRPLLKDSCIVGEESTEGRVGQLSFNMHEYAWIVDAVDGTHRFIEGQPDFATMICLCKKGEPLYGWVYLPTEDRLFAGGKDVGVYDNGRKLSTEAPHKALHDLIGSLSPSSFWPFEAQINTNCQRFQGLRHNLCAGYKFAGLLTGGLDFAAFGRAAPWDLAAGFILIKELGGHAATWEDKEIDMEMLFEQNREWYLATRQKDDWQPVNRLLFTSVTMTDQERPSPDVPHVA